MTSNTRVITSVPYATSLQITKQPGNMSPNILKLEGYYEGATVAWLQFFDSLGVPANGTVPIYEESLGTVAPNGYSWQFNPGIIMRLNTAFDSLPLTMGLIAVISTTQGSLTVGTGSNLSSFYITIEEWETLPTSGKTPKGDTTTSRNILTVASPGANIVIDKIIYSNLTATAGFLKLFTQTNLVAGNLPLEQWALAANAPLTELNFRGVRFIPQTQDTSQSPPVINNTIVLVAEQASGAYAAANSINCTLQTNYDLA